MQKGKHQEGMYHPPGIASFQCQYRARYEGKEIITPVDITISLDDQGRLFYKVQNNGNSQHQLAQSPRDFEQEDIEIMVANILLDRMNPDETKEKPIYKIIDQNKKNIEELYSAVREFAQKKRLASI